MENRNVYLFGITFMLNTFVLLFSFTAVTNAAVAPSIIDIVKNDTKLCNASKFLYDTKFSKSCASLPYPTTPWSMDTETIDTYLCLGIYDTAYKICQYSSQSQIPLNITTIFTSYVQKFDLMWNQNEEQKFCEDLQGFSSLYNKIDLLWNPLIENLNTPRKCMKICFDFNDRLHPVCVLLGWIKSIDDNVKRQANNADVDHSNNKVITNNQPVKANTEVNQKQAVEIIEAQNVIQDKSKLNTPNIVPTDHVKPNAVEIKSVEEKLSKNKTQKKSDQVTDQVTDQANIELHAETIHKENKNDATKKIPINNDPLISSTNIGADNISNKEVTNDGNVKNSNKEQGVDDLKTSTLSENTQDHYDAGNPEEDMESNIGDNDDIDDTIQQPLDTGNQNENPQEAFEQKDNLQYSNVQTEDDSHFFTYFTVITIACIAGYLGYHNKQKILAIVLEGRRSKSNRGRRRPSTASYRKLDCTLEEAVTSQCNANVTHVIY